MPIYDYKCTQCAQTFELFIGLNDDASCPQCKSVLVERLPCAAATHVWKPGTDISNPRKAWHGFPHGDGT